MRGMKRWWVLGFTLLGTAIAVIDNTVLTVSLPTIIEDLDTDVRSAQWIFTGYALVFASVLVIGGRLGDMFGPRRILFVGAALFGGGSLVAALSTSLPMLIVGESLIEGVGAALLIPNTMALIARTFEGRARITAFAAYATVIGAAASIGPVLGGYLTTYHSWRWAFFINVFIAPAMIVGLWITSDRDEITGDRQPLDLRGAVLVATGTFLLVFGLTQGEVYGWWEPVDAFVIGSVDVWPTSMPISIVPLSFLVGVGLIVLFLRAELRLERNDEHPLFEFSQFRFRTFRLANIATFAMAFAQLGISIALVLFLQEARGLSPVTTGLWLVPSGMATLVGAPFGGWLSRRAGSVPTLRIGATVVVAGTLLMAWALSSDAAASWVFVTFFVYGFSNGLVASQINRVLLHDIPPAGSGAASGINSTARQIATALGVATIGMIFATVTEDHGVHAALWPSMALAALAFAWSAVVLWRTPPIDDEEHILDAAAVDGLARADALEAAIETHGA